MNSRYGVVFSTALLMALGACAGGGAGGGGGSAMPSAPAIRGETLAQGESPRNSDETRAAEDHIDQALEAKESGDDAAAMTHYRMAVQSAEAAVALDPTNPLAHRLLGEAQIGAGQYAAGSASWDEAERLRPIYQLELGPQREQAWFNLYNEGAPSLNAGDYDTARALFEGAHLIYQDRPEIMIILGQLYTQEAMYDEAVELFEMAGGIIDSPRLAEVDSVTAADWTEQAQQIPVMITQAYLSAGRYQEAATLLEDLVAADPSNTMFQRNLAVAYVEMSDTVKAGAVFERLMNADLDPVERFQVGIGLYNLGDYPNAASTFSSILDEWPQDRDAAEWWARSLGIWKQNREDAGETIDDATMNVLLAAGQKWAELDSSSQTARVLVAGTANDMGNADLARDMMNAASALPIIMHDLQIRRDAMGATVSGSLENVSASQGSSVTVEFTFYGPSGQAIGNESATVTLPGPQARQIFQVQFSSDEAVAGYTYVVR